MKRPLAVLVLLACAIAPFARAAGAEETESKPFTLEIRDDTPPRVGNATTFVTRGVVNQITITYSPAAKVAETEVIEANGTNLVLWRPKRAGVVKISAPGHLDRLISVRFDSVPTGGVVIMLLAGFILFGGAFFSLRTLLAET